MLGKISRVFRQGHAYLLILLSIVLITLVLSVRARINQTAWLIVEPERFSKSSKQRVEGEVIALAATGFDPKQITRSKGPFLLLINNYSRLSPATLLIERDNGAPVRKISLPGNKLTWSDVIDLPPGNYRLRETTHSHWFCQITLH